ncbi:hypothetical protein LTS10_010190 [Elasticomyces elasticus]|nr:hypothetical protein LTS10_010190 [Elasticomyces elasticus]
MCGYSNNGKVIATSSGMANLEQCMDACDKQAGCKAADFHTGANNCYLIGPLGTNIVNSTYNLGLAPISTALTISSSRSSTTKAACASATGVAVTFDELVATSYGDSVYLVGSIAQLGSWDASAGIAMVANQYTTSNPLWSITITFPPGTSMEYKFVTIDISGDVTWEADLNHALTVSHGLCKCGKRHGDSHLAEFIVTEPCDVLQ